MSKCTLEPRLLFFCRDLELRSECDKILFTMTYFVQTHLMSTVTVSLAFK